MIRHQVESLASAGVTDIVLAVNYRPDVMVSKLKQVSLIVSLLLSLSVGSSGDADVVQQQYEEIYNVKIEFSVETEPLGTAGPLKLAEKILGKDDSPFF